MAQRLADEVLRLDRRHLVFQEEAAMNWADEFGGSLMFVSLMVTLIVGAVLFEWRMQGKKK